LLIANRGEIAIRIGRAAADLGVETVAVHSHDDAASLHVRLADRAVALQGVGPRAYLDIAAVVAAALDAGCDSVHPGYGFLSESAVFARACQAAGLTFVGGSPEALDLFGDKARARAFAAEHGVPLAPGTEAAASLDEVRALQASVGAIMIKALAGGGGRGMRIVAAEDDPAAAYEACAREAEGAFGDGRLYAEAIIPHARHIEVQIVGDGQRAIALHDRECSIQRRRQKLIEVAPAIGLSPEVRAKLQDASIRMAQAAKLRGLATFEYLLNARDGHTAAFIETNPRLQVEHTVTEAVTGLDLVQLQLRLADGESLADCGLDDGPPEVNGAAIQLRVNLESLAADGQVAGGGGGILLRYEPPSGPGVRVDGYGFGGYRTNPSFDSLIAKLIVHAPTLAAASARAGRAAAEFRIEGAPSSLPLLRALLERPEFVEGRADTGFLEANLPALLARADELAPPQIAEAITAAAQARIATPPGALAVGAPLRGTVVSLEIASGDVVAAGQPVAVIEAMKMQHVVGASVAGVIHSLAAAVGDTLDEGAPLVFIEPGEASLHAATAEAIDLEHIRPDLAEVMARTALTRDSNRPEAVARRRRTNQRTARENLDHLFDPGTFKEFGALAIAAQKTRRAIEDLQVRTPADGIITGVGEVGGARCVALAYDFTVLAGTQGYFGHMKTDRVLEFAEHWKLPVVFYVEGGGGRPGEVDVDPIFPAALNTTSFTTFARMSGNAPRIAIASGRCFAGNAVFFGCADITIATEYANIGLGGPAMIEGGGLGVFTPDEIGPASVHYANGVVDLLVADEAEATAAAQHLLGIFQGDIDDWTCADQRTLRHLIPENRVRVYDVRRIIQTLADTGSWIELRGGYGQGMITGFLRIEGRRLGVIANDPRRLGGAIDSEGAEKAGRFLQLCDAFDVPVLSLCDTPGFMVGPASDATGSVRRGARLFVVAGGRRVPLFAVVLRKAYGLGVMAMAGGDFSASDFTIAWPTAEFGPMGLEGAVRLGYRKELEAETDPTQREALFQKLVGEMYQNGKAISVAQANEVDAVIDPAETRDWIVRGVKSCPPRSAAAHRRSFIDVW
jgi:acetyl/propionyl-CoA carboxylase alpha subunit/acetyl-CoA carboxylase carboxyltransferase component